MWKSTIQDEALKKKVVKKIEEIAECTDRESLDGDQIGLHSGSIGRALFFFYYSKFIKDKRYTEVAYGILSEVISKINGNSYNYHSFCRGLSGVTWGIEFLHNQKFIKDNPNEIFEDIYDYLAVQMIKDAESSNFDYLHGAIGTSVALMNKKIYTKSIECIMDTLIEKGERKDNLIKWKTSDFNGGYEGYNLSLAHGSASILYFFLLTFKNGIRPELSKEIAYEIINFYFINRSNINTHNSVFPSIVLSNGEVRDSRLAWCYGDTGVCSILLLASFIFNDKKIREYTIEILIETTKRKKQEETGVLDAGFCHGSIGLAQIYSRIYNTTGIKRFKESAEYWVQQSLEYAIHNDGLAGYKFYQYNKFGGEWINQTNLLVGITGVGLSLISQVSKIEPSWDKCFLLSI